MSSRRPYENSITSLILDVVETWAGEWLSTREIITIVQNIRPGTSESTIRRAFQHIVAGRSDLSAWAPIEVELREVFEETDWRRDRKFPMTFVRMGYRAYTRQSA